MKENGIDVHKNESQIGLLTDQGEVLERRIATRRDRFATVLGDRPRARNPDRGLHGERMGGALPRGVGHEMIVPDPNFAPMYATLSRRVKADRRDAQALMDACRLGAYRPIHRTSEALQCGRSYQAPTPRPSLAWDTLAVAPCRGRGSGGELSGPSSRLSAEGPLLRLVTPGLIVMCLATSIANAATIQLTPEHDAEVRQSTPSFNYGVAPSLSVRSEAFSSAGYVYLRFDLTGVPAGSQISHASLSMVAFNGYAWGGDGTVYVHFVPDDSWTENVIVWGNRPAHSTEILGSWWLWYNGTPSDQAGWAEGATLREAVQRELNGDGRMSMMLRSPGYDTQYYSREHAESASKGPRLTLMYSVADVTPIANPATELRIATIRPNPVVREGVLAFELPRAGSVRFVIVDAGGRCVRSLHDGALPPGAYEARWNLRDDAGEHVPPGIYFARLHVSGRTASRRFAVVR